MGLNSAILLLNDALHDIENNPIEFTKKVVQAIQGSGFSLSKKGVDIGVGSHGNAATLFHMAHADEHQVYLVGGNQAVPIERGCTYISGYEDPQKTNLKLLKQMADAAGYRLVKKRN
jgi:hypothetical protein